MVPTINVTPGSTFPVTMTPTTKTVKMKFRTKCRGRAVRAHFASASGVACALRQGKRLQPA
jgi:hypothetical protein